jgi:hypothetical protein
MSGGAALRVTPAELAGVAGQVQALARAAAAESAGLRSATAGVQPPDPSADQVLVSGARTTLAAVSEVSELIRSLLATFGQTLDRQAAALAAAAHGYAYVEQQVAASLRPGERRRE